MQGLFSVENSRPAWANKIKDIATRIGGQAALARIMGIRQQSVSRWIRGEKEPSVASYAILLKLANEKEQPALFDRYLQRTGAEEVNEDLHKRKSQLRNKVSEIGKQSAMYEAVSIPLLKDPAAAGTARAINEREIETVLTFPREFVGKGSGLVALKVSGDSMAPFIETGYIVLVDTSEREPKRLVNTMVAARESDGVTIKWLRREGSQFMLVPQHTSLRHPVRLVGPDKDVSIIGKVIKWLGEPPKP
jgi:SOS-response transcriptional repressor LexA